MKEGIMVMNECFCSAVLDIVSPVEVASGLLMIFLIPILLIVLIAIIIVLQLFCAEMPADGMNPRCWGRIPFRLLRIRRKIQRMNKNRPKTSSTDIILC